MNLPEAEVIALDSMRAASPGYTPEDLDILAFMRKRSDVMSESHYADLLPSCRPSDQNPARE